VTLVRDRLYINNELYIVPEENDINKIGHGNLEDDFIPYRYTNRANRRPPKTTAAKSIDTDEILRVPCGA
jgi:hypothetical protein